MIPWIIFAVVVVPLVVIAFAVTRRKTRVGERVASQTAEEQALIFERFYRPETEATRRNQGAGLGLPIARALVELHGGRLWVESAPGAGATFWIALPTDEVAHRFDEERADEDPGR